MANSSQIEWDTHPSIDGNGAPYIRGFVGGQHRWIVSCAGRGRVCIYSLDRHQTWSWKGGFDRGVRKAEREELGRARVECVGS